MRVYYLEKHEESSAKFVKQGDCRGSKVRKQAYVSSGRPNDVKGIVDHSDLRRLVLGIALRLESKKISHLIINHYLRGRAHLDSTSGTYLDSTTGAFCT